MLSNLKKKLFLIASMGLGLGLGVTVTVAQPGLQVKATPEFAQKEYPIFVKSLALSEAMVFSVSRTKEAPFTELTSYGLGVSRSTVLISEHTDVSNVFKAVAIGDSLTLVGTNNGRYSYTITQIRQTDRGAQGALVSDTREEVIVVIRQHPWSQSQTMYIASYKQ